MPGRLEAARFVIFVGFLQVHPHHMLTRDLQTDVSAASVAPSKSECCGHANPVDDSTSCLRCLVCLVALVQSPAAALTAHV